MVVYALYPRLCNNHPFSSSRIIKNIYPNSRFTSTCFCYCGYTFCYAKISTFSPIWLIPVTIHINIRSIIRRVSYLMKLPSQIHFTCPMITPILNFLFLIPKRFIIKHVFITSIIIPKVRQINLKY